MTDMQPLPLSSEAKRLAAQLEAIATQPAPTGHNFHSASIGTGFYFAYEQLRNAADYREHHLLLRSAIERYLVRRVSWLHFQPAGADLVTELTQSGYLKNDTVPMDHVAQIDTILSRYAKLVSDAPKNLRAKRNQMAEWFYHIASVQLEELLHPQPRLTVFMAFAYEHYLATVDKSQHTGFADDTAYRVALYCAMQRSIFKSDLPTTRYYCLAASLPGLDEHSLGHFVAMNELIDQLYQAPQTNRLARLINRYGAPMRMLRELATDGKLDLTDRSSTIARLKRICSQQYALTHERLNKRIVKTIAFVFITKVLIGVSIEVPYDMFVHGVIAWLPLTLNVMFPLVYMILLGGRITMPDRHNTELVTAWADRILYQDAGAPVEYRAKRRVTSSSLRTIFSLIYVIGFCISFGLLSWALVQLHFNVVNGMIFFIFLSAVSFLGFRLRQSARELAMLDSRQGLVQTLADFLSTPFVRVGWWISDRYARMNLVTVLLDMLIEMPLKTSLRLIQQWIGFLRDKQEEL
jgi:hypothetical protein